MPWSDTNYFCSADHQFQSYKIFIEPINQSSEVSHCAKNCKCILLERTTTQICLTIAANVDGQFMQ